MKRICILICAASLAGATFAGETSASLKIKELSEEYAKTQQVVADGQAHLLRLEGAISILKIMDESTTASDLATTHTKKKRN